MDQAVEVGTASNHKEHLTSFDPEFKMGPIQACLALTIGAMEQAFVGATNMRSIAKFVLPAVLGVYVMMLAAPSRAQVLYGSIVGQVVDTTSAIVPGATVRITHRETNQSRESVTSANG